jgi:hypothetical protein
MRPFGGYRINGGGRLGGRKGGDVAGAGIVVGGLRQVEISHGAARCLIQASGVGTAAT